MDCSIDEHRPIGDHDLIVGAVDALAVPAETEPLLFHRSLFHGLRETR
ncbi:hypothetical protein ACN93_21750 [Gordonia paraffinivorans]|nr:hypothetical protein ACN93_21750 [Gordonia paraffinivorans]